jgi:hypothetical protein
MIPAVLAFIIGLLFSRRLSFNQAVNVLAFSLITAHWLGQYPTYGGGIAMTFFFAVLGAVLGGVIKR